MGTLIDKIKSWFKPRKTEEYTINRKYSNDAELKDWLERRKSYCKESGFQMKVMYGNFRCKKLYGKCRFIIGNRVCSTASLMRGIDNMVIWKFED
jgi:hypothetical protein